MSKRRILIAEDYQTNRDIIRMHLMTGGYDVMAVENGQAAVDACSDTHFDLIVMDLKMPVLDGLKATRIIRASTQCRDTPIIAVTASADEETRQSCMECGMNDIMIKPVRRDSLLGAASVWTSGEKTSGGEEPVTTPRQGNLSNSALPMDYQRALEEFAGNNEILENALRGFLESIDMQIGLMRDAIETGDHDAVRAEAHKIRGGAANLTADSLAESAAAVEKAAETGTTEGLAKLVVEMQKQSKVLKDYVEKL